MLKSACAHSMEVRGGSNPDPLLVVRGTNLPTRQHLPLLLIKLPNVNQLLALEFVDLHAARAAELCLLVSFCFIGLIDGLAQLTSQYSAPES